MDKINWLISLEFKTLKLCVYIENFKFNTLDKK